MPGDDGALGAGTGGNRGRVVLLRSHPSGCGGRNMRHLPSSSEEKMKTPTSWLRPLVTPGLDLICYLYFGKKDFVPAVCC